MKKCPFCFEEIQEQATAPEADAGYKLRRTGASAPTYPRRAWLDRTEGWAFLPFRRKR